MSQEKWKEIAGFWDNSESKILATSPSGERSIFASHYTVNGATPDLRYEQTYFAVQLQTDNSNNSLDADALIISLKTFQGGKEETSIALGVFNQSASDYITKYAWTTGNRGYCDYIYTNQDGVSTKKLQQLKTQGIAVISGEADLPRQINVETAVDFWLTKINEMIQNPQQLAKVDLSVAGTIKPFEI